MNMPEDLVNANDDLLVLFSPPPPPPPTGCTPADIGKIQIVLLYRNSDPLEVLKKQTDCSG